MSKFELQRRAISNALRDARHDLAKAKQAAEGQPDNADWKEWIDEATDTITGLEMALKSVLFLENMKEVLS